MKIAVVGPTHPLRGGIAHYTTRLCQELDNRHDIRLFALRRQYPAWLFPGRTQVDASKEPFRFPNDPCLEPLNPLSWATTLSRLRAFAPDMLLLNWWHPFLAPAVGSLCRRARRPRSGASAIPALLLCHNVLPHEPLPGMRALTRFALGGAGGFLVHCQPHRVAIEELFPGKPVAVHPHPPYDLFAAADPSDPRAAKARLGLAGKRVVLFFGLIRRYKGLDLLLEAFGRLDGAGDSALHLLVAGEFYDDRSFYAAKLEALSAQGRLTLIDRYLPNEEVPELFAAADLFVAPYRDASQSGVIGIAQALGTPVLATAVGGLPEMVRHGVDGWLVSPDDPQALADAVRGHFQPGVAAGLRAAALPSWAGLVRAIEGLAGRLV